jgi:hypothetical protein
MATQKKTDRRRSALARLEAQMEKGKKPAKVNGKTTQTLVDLEEADKKRMGREIEKLRSVTV